MKKKHLRLCSIFLTLVILFTMMPCGAVFAEETESLGKAEILSLYYYADEQLVVGQVSKGPDGVSYQFQASNSSSFSIIKEVIEEYSSTGYSLDVSSVPSGMTGYVRVRYYIDENTVGEWSNVVKKTMVSGSNITASDITVNSSDSEQSFSVDAASTETDTLHYVSNNENIAVDSAGIITVKAGYVGDAEITITNVVDGEETSSKRITVTVIENSDPEYPFEDVSENDYYYKPVLWAVEKEITKGTDQTHFSPEIDCNRAQVMTFLWRAAGKPEPSSDQTDFVDVPQDAYYRNAVLWGTEKGITKGVDQTHFAPNDIITRGQAVTLLYNYCEKPSHEASNPFEDVSEGAYYYDAVLWASENNITTGTDENHFSPSDNCTRGQIVTFLYRALA